MSCYRKIDGVVNATDDSVCSDYVYGDGVTPCCDRGHAARCTPNNLCYNSYWDHGNSGGYGWLTAGCTDNTYNSDACNQRCASTSHPDVVYNTETSLWHCCGVTKDGATDCDNPTSETFEGASPDALMAAANIVVSTSTTSRSTATSISASSSTSSSDGVSTVTVTGSGSSATTSPTTIAASSNSGLSTGAKAGIGVGVAIGAIGLICGIISLVWITRLRKKNSQRKHDSGSAPPYTYNDANAAKTGYDQPSKDGPIHGGFGGPAQVYEAPDSTITERRQELSA